MNKIFLITLISLTSLSLSAQNITITVCQNSIELKNNALHFKYIIENNSDSTIVLFNMYNIDIENVSRDLLEKKDTVSNYFTSRLSALITKEGNYLPFTVAYGHNWSLLLDLEKEDNNDVFESSEEEVFEFSKENYVYKSSKDDYVYVPPKEEYIVFFPHSYEEFSYNLPLSDTIRTGGSKARGFFNYHYYSLELTEGVYEFQLCYISSKSFEWVYTNAKKTDVRLKNSFIFEGIIESNVCYFVYPGLLTQ